MQFFTQLLGDPLGFYRAHQLLLAQLGINALLTLSMYITLRAGMLTLANVGFMAVGAYVSVLLHVNGHTQEHGTGAASPEAVENLAVTIAEHLSLAIANLQLRETLRGQSVRDSLTGLTVPGASSED